MTLSGIEQRVLEQDLGKQIAPEEGGLNQANSSTVPVILLRHGKNRNAHVHLPTKPSISLSKTKQIVRISSIDTYTVHIAKKEGSKA